MLQIRYNIKLLRELAGLSQLAFGQVVGASKDMIYSYESGKAEAPDDLVDKSAGFLGVTTENFKTKRFKPENFNKLEIQQRIFDARKTPKSDVTDDYREKYIKLLESQLSLATEKIQHLMFLILARADTNQNALADLLVKQKIVSANEVEDRLSTENGENYQRLKKEVGMIEPSGK